MKTSQKIYLPFKRLIGILGSFVGIILCFLLLWWWVIPVNAIVTKGHPFFVSKRIGKNGKPFKLIKFRSMKLNTNPEMTSAYADTEHLVTGFGRFLRASSIDETTQLLNIFIGQMAFIGPRPLIDVHEDHITIEIRRENGAIHLKPGLSGYAQVHGRTAVSPEQKGQMDGIYYKRFNLWLDSKIFLYTFLRLFGVAKGR